MSTTAKTRQLRFGVDADNVLANSSGKAIELLNARRAFTDPVRRDEITVRPFHKSPGFVSRNITQDEVSAVIDAAWRSHHQQIRLMDEGLPSVISGLRELGVLIEIITTMGARDHTLHPNLRDWLNRNKVPYDTLNFVSGSEEKLAYPVHTIVDDEPELAVGLAKTRRPGLVYDAPWNRQFVGAHLSDPHASSLIIPVKDWAMVGQQVRALRDGLRTD